MACRPGDLEPQQAALQWAVVEPRLFDGDEADVTGQRQVAGQDECLPSGIARFEDLAHLLVERFYFGLFSNPRAIGRIRDQNPWLLRRGFHRSELPCAEPDEFVDAG